jgi:single-stranded DNA-binding protein
MNKCHFLGKLAEDTTLENFNGATLVRFLLEVEEYRKDKNGLKKKRKDYLEFEAWDTAAVAINKQAIKNDFLVVEAVARRDDDGTFFRVTSFKIFKNQFNIEE